MKILTLFLMCLGAMGAIQAQEPLSLDEALKQLYSQYDAGKKTAQWLCTKGQERDTPHEGWPCVKGDARVSVSVLLMAEVQEGSAEKIYLVTSAKPFSNPDDYNCHACAPAIGVGVFAWQAEHWVLQSANAALGFYGGWGSPPWIELVQIGPERHGILLSVDDMGQGYASSFKRLLTPLGKTVSDVWSIEDEQDNLGAIDPDDKLNKQVPYRSSAAFKFNASDPEGGGTDLTDYFDIEVISRGNDREDFNHPVKSENWTEIYRFKDGKYRLLRHRDFIEVRKPKRTPVS
ncbi:MAG: hypothetical protein WCA89_14220 [Terracidiphilus sp.]|jgi:hypothetical protein